MTEEFRGLAWQSRKRLRKALARLQAEGQLLRFDVAKEGDDKQRATHVGIWFSRLGDNVAQMWVPYNATVPMIRALVVVRGKFAAC